MRAELISLGEEASKTS